MKWILLLLSFMTLAQKPEGSTHFKLEADSFYGIDDFEAFYYGKNEVFYKRTSESTLQFYDVQLGDLSEVDLINPLKILLFYKDTQTVVILDNRLNERQRISLNEIQPFRYFEHVKLAGERRLWLHDLDNNRLELYDYINDRTLISTAVLQSNVQLLLSDYNFCHIMSSSNIETYNSYGSRTGVLELTAANLIDYDFENLVFLKANEVYLYQLRKDFSFERKEIQPISISEKDVKSLYLKNGKLYIWHDKRISVYKINPIKK